MRCYQVNLLKDANSPGPAGLIEHVKNELIPGLGGNITTYGVFQGLFGLASNELYLVLSSENPNFLIGGKLMSESCQLIDSTDFIPTVRPTEHSPRTQDGVFVFRWFNVLGENVDEIAKLSEIAWETFEGEFDTQVQALFAQQNLANAAPSEPGKMLLITWYKDFAVWQASRQPPAEARENFLRRHQLTLEARPIATRLAL